jgi:hypothetical protein
LPTSYCKKYKSNQRDIEGEAIELLQIIVTRQDEISNNLGDIADRIEDVGGVFNIKDVCDKLDSMSLTLDSITTGIDLNNI